MTDEVDEDEVSVENVDEDEQAKQNDATEKRPGTIETVATQKKQNAPISSYIALSNKIKRAKRRTVRMTITIIVTFIVCWYLITFC